MRSFFNLDGPLFTALSRLADLIILNILFILCSLPVVTVGASCAALSYVLLKMRDGEEGYVTKSFFRAFKQNFRQATIIWVMMLALALVLFLDFRIVQVYEGSMGTVLRVSVYLGALIWGMLFFYVFPLQARFANTIRNTLQNALLLAIANAPRTLCMIVIAIAAFFLTFWNAETIAWGILFWLMVGFSALAYVNVFFLTPVFRRLMPPEAEPEQKNEEESEETASQEV